MDLNGKRIVITRPAAQAQPFIAALQALGASPLAFPVIAITPVEDPTCLDSALRQLDRYNWLVLTSVNGVEALWERMDAIGIHHLPAVTRVAAIGPQTAAALHQRGVQPEFMPDEYVAEAILPGLGDLHDRWVLLPRADIARPALADLISQAGGVAHEIAAYRTLPATPDPHSIQALRQGVDVITFTSSSTVRNFISLLAAAGLDPLHLPGDPLVACIGPITASTARELGFAVAVVAAEYTTAGLLNALQEFKNGRLDPGRQA